MSVILYRKDHKKRVEEMVAQAIVQRTLDIERNRQFDIQKKLEEIKKIENVRKLKLSRIDVMRLAINSWLSTNKHYADKMASQWLRQWRLGHLAPQHYGPE